MTANGQNQRIRPELLAPAGNREAFLCALQAGADAVYLGGPRFGARAFAENFSEEELAATIEEAHLYGVRIYLTVNILTREKELEELVAFVRRMYAHGLDGVIIQDTGVALRLSEECPGLSLHASTQMSVSSAESARYLKRLGFCRVVPARELSLEEITAIRKDAGVEVESFIHGAMCYSYSGKCLMSSFLGGRSGNRGRCAGTCRLPYKILEENGQQACRDGMSYPLSMRDMCVLDILPLLIDAGIDSFKIEGRMKKAEYVAGTTAIYRKYIDRYYEWDAEGRKDAWAIDPKDRRDLLDLYIRTDLCSGYYRQRNGRDMVTIGSPGYSGASEELLNRIREQYPAKLPGIPIDGEAWVYPGRETYLKVVYKDAASGRSVSAESRGPEAGAARNRPLTEEELSDRISKTGDTPFVFQKLAVHTDGNAFLPVSALNELRRSALQRLSEELSGAKTAAEMTPEGMPKTGKKTVKKTEEKKAEGAEGSCSLEELLPAPGLFAQVRTIEQLRAAEEAGVDYPVLDGDLPDTLTAEELAYPERTYIALPHIFRKGDTASLERILHVFSGKTAGFVIRNAEELEFLREKHYYGRVIADSTLPVWNTKAARLLFEDCLLVTLSPELSGKEWEETFIKEQAGRAIIPVYGRMPMMITANCVKKTAGRCEHREKELWYLEDRKGMRFPVRCACRHCYNVIYNSVPTSLHRFCHDEIFKAVPYKVLVFTDESAERVRRIIESGTVLYHHVPRGRAGETQENIALTAFRNASRNAAFTGGHYRKGAI